MQKITHTNINKAIKRIKEADMTPVTELQMAQQSPFFGRIIYPAGESTKSGLIMSYTEASRRFFEKFPKGEFTKDMYQEMLNKLVELQKDRLTLRGETKKQVEYMKKFILDHYSESEISDEQIEKFDSLSYIEKRDIYRTAKKRAAKQGEENYEANKFTIKLEELLKEIK